MSIEAPEILYKTRPDEISARQFVLKTRSYLKYLLSFWYLLLIGGGIAGFYSYQKYAKIKETYPARISFFVKTKSSMKDNSLIVKGISRFVTSANPIQATLFSKTIVDNKSDLIINHYLKIYRTHKRDHLDSSIPNDFVFTQRDLSKFSPEELQVFTNILDKVTTPVKDFSDGFATATFDDKLGFITINFSSPSENFSVVFVEQLYKVFIESFMERTVYSENLAYTSLKEKVTQLKSSFDLTFDQLLRNRDKYDEMLKKIKEGEEIVGANYQAVKNQKLEIKTDLLKEEYLDAAEKLKTVEVELNKSIPVITISEKPMRKGKPYKPSTTLASLKGAIMGTLFVVFILFLLKVYRDITNETSLA